MPAPVWRGTSAIKEQPDSPKYEYSKEGPKVTKIFMGPLGTLLANAPRRLDTVAGVSSTLRVDHVLIERATGGRGIMTVTLVIAPLQDIFGGGDTDSLEIEWVEVTKKLETHPRYQAGGAKALTEDDLDAIEEWRNASNKAARTAAAGKLSENGKDFCRKLRRGTDSYVDYTPIARVTQKVATRPNCGGCGMRSSPPSEIAIPTYQYLKTADRAVRRDRLWEHVQEWTGAKLVDEDIYPAS